MQIDPSNVADGALAEAIALAGSRLAVAVGGRRGRRRATDLTVARWFDTYHFTSRTPDFPELSDASGPGLTDVLRSDELQAALQELLAARLTDAPESDAARARQVITITLAGVMDGEPLANYYDDQICELVARLEADDARLLAQIRTEAFSARMLSVLHAIERHTARLTTRPSQRTEASFLGSYRRHVIDQHGKLEPPDFDRRRRVPLAEIYVPTLITHDVPPERSAETPPTDQPPVTVYGLAGQIDRSVLLGDPGGGKTTAANVLMHQLALDEAGRVPFLVTLRDYAALDPPDRSVVGHIEYVLETLYQCPAPAGLVDLLLLTGRAVIIFDGLDELLDTSRRADVATRIERFCAEYPLARVLVTARVIGYEQAALDAYQFTRYRLGGFGAEQAAEYARKWFAQDSDADPGDAEAFLSESAGVPDLRSNPLLLSLMCILYRGAGSLPRDRAGIYGECASLLFRGWDARRRIHRDLRAGHMIEPALRHLAWWLYQRNEAQPWVTERDLVAATAEFLRERGFESADDAHDAAREFVDFCRDRMWVFTDVGTTAAGERLYAFTHRTFLEYFAAAQLAYESDTPEQLARGLIPRVVNREWVLAELAVQIKDQTSGRGAARMYTALLAACRRRSAKGRAAILEFLALCLRAVAPSPQLVRDLTRRIFLAALADGPDRTNADPLSSLLGNCGPYRDIVAIELKAALAETVSAGGRTAAVAIWIAASLPDALTKFIDGHANTDEEFWESCASELLSEHSPDAARASQENAYIQHIMLASGLITLQEAMETARGFSALFRDSESFFPGLSWAPYLTDVLRDVGYGRLSLNRPGVRARLEEVGAYLNAHPATPWLHGTITFAEEDFELADDDGSPIAFPAAPGFRDPGIDEAALRSPLELSSMAYLGAVAIAAMMIEQSTVPDIHGAYVIGSPLGLDSYLDCRFGISRDLISPELPELPVPAALKQLFRDWAAHRIELTVPGS